MECSLNLAGKAYNPYNLALTNETNVHDMPDRYFVKFGDPQKQPTTLTSVGNVGVVGN